MKIGIFKKLTMSLNRVKSRTGLDPFYEIALQYKLQGRYVQLFSEIKVTIKQRGF